MRHHLLRYVVIAVLCLFSSISYTGQITLLNKEEIRVTGESALSKEEAIKDALVTVQGHLDGIKINSDSVTRLIIQTGSAAQLHTEVQHTSQIRGETQLRYRLVETLKKDKAYIVKILISISVNNQARGFQGALNLSNYGVKEIVFFDSLPYSITSNISSKITGFNPNLINNNSPYRLGVALKQELTSNSSCLSEKVGTSVFFDESCHHGTLRGTITFNLSSNSGRAVKLDSFDFSCSLLEISGVVFNPNQPVFLDQEDDKECFLSIEHALKKTIFFN